MSALAKAVLALHERGATMTHNGHVWIPEQWWEKWLELARREAKNLCGKHRISDCAICKWESSR